MTYNYRSGFPDVDLYEHLEKIRPRPRMWLGEKNIYFLAMWIGGMETLSHDSLCNGPKVYNLVSEPDFNRECDEQPGFSDFVREKYDLGDKFVPWCKGLVQAELKLDSKLMVNKAISQAVDRFFIDLDEFRKTYG
jgi:hypothetical protein